MKLLSVISIICLISTSIIGQTQSEEEHKPSWYITGGTSLWSEDVDTTVGEGFGYKIALGFQLTKTFGLEWNLDGAPAIDPEVLTDAILELFVWDEAAYETETHGLTYSSFLGTFRYPIEENVWILLKAGFANYSAEFKSDLELTEHYFSGSTVTEYEIAIEEDGSSPVISVGVEFPLRSLENTSVELLATRYLEEDVAATTLSFGLKYTF
ncbi:MAG: hypothetical protein OXH84_04425 [Gammaproteobacteria bacterium]|nr:hypothetical protein [Gammaproteobacteria bacterium]